MEVLYPCCCGLDVHKQSVAACLNRMVDSGQRVKKTRTFGTTTDELRSLAQWLKEEGCTHVAMESTGVYWKPVYNILEGDLELLVVNAQHIKAVPGRKTDVRDCEWIADLLQHGLLRASFVPSREQRELRDLTRTRTILTDERSASVNRLQKVLEDANIKLTSVATDVMGVSGRAILQAMLEGKTDPETLADLAKGRLRNKQEKLAQALSGQMSDHHRSLISIHLAHIDFLEEQIEGLSEQIKERLRPFEEELSRLDTIPGVGRQTAEVIVAEIGLDMSRFPTAGHLASWAGMCPGNNESAGKRKGGKTRKGNKWLRRALTEAASRKKKEPTYVTAQYHRFVVCRGKKKASVATGHRILVIAYHLLKNQDVYHDLGPTYHDDRQRQRAYQRAIHNLEAMGFDVVVTPKQNAA